MSQDRPTETPSDSGQTSAAPAETPPADKPAETPAPAAPAGPPKSQLRRRVEARITELEAAVEKLSADPSKHKQVRAILLSLKGVHDWMGPDTEKMGPLEAAQMSRWLASVAHLGITE